MGKEDTVIRKAYLSPPRGREIQDVGLRPFILSQMINYGFSRGNVQNIDDGRVVVAIEGTKEKIREFLEALAKKLAAEAKKDYSLIPAGIQMSEIKNHDNPAPVGIYDLKDLASALMLEETSRGVGAITKGFRGMDAKLTIGFGDLSAKLDGLPEVLREISRKLGNEQKSQ